MASGRPHVGDWAGMRHVIVGLLVAVAAPAAGQPVAAPASEEAMAAARAAFPPVAEPERLEPQQAVPGCGERPLPRGAADALPEASHAALKRFQAKHQGLGLVVLEGGAIIAEHYAGDFGPDSRFQSFSMAKSLMALAVGAAIGDRILADERQPLSRFVARPGALGSVPLVQFLTMSSGMEQFRPDLDPRNRQLYFGPDISGAALSAQIVDAPGSRFSYNNASSQVVGEALQQGLLRAGRGDYAQYLSSRIWCAIGASPASLWVEAPGRPRFYMGVSASVRDWARVGQLILDRGRAAGQRIIPQTYLDRMLAPSPANSIYGYQVWRGSPHVDRRGYGGGLDLVVARAEPFRADDVIFFDGFGGQRVYVVP
ncbi:MAG: serine hydrolase domain-containing protein, partial [Thermaurantiacus sp.]